MDQSTVHKICDDLEESVEKAVKDMRAACFAAIGPRPAKPEEPELEWAVCRSANPDSFCVQGRERGFGKPLMSGLTADAAALIANALNSAPAMRKVCQRQVDAWVGSDLSKAAAAALALRVYGLDGKRTDGAE